jgi:monoamine oxidase
LPAADRALDPNQNLDHYYWITRRASPIPHPIDTEALIIGAGAAGLYAADRLRQAGIRFVVLEADAHAGGRVYSRPEMKTHLGLVLDEGANLINSTDTLAIRLLDKFDIPYVRRLTPGADSMFYVYEGRAYDQTGMEQLLYTSSATAMAQIADDQEVWNHDADRANDPRFINESIATYLARHGADRALTTMLRSFFWSEYGRELENLNLHVLFDYFKLDLATKSFDIIPNVDEAYTVPGGAGQIIERLEEACHAHIEYGRRVFLIKDSNSEHITVQAHDENGAVKSYRGRMLFFAAPLHSLRKIEVMVEGVSTEALAEARAVTYGRGTKLHLKFEEGFHKLYHHPGIFLTDTGEQIWPSSTGQGGAGLLTVLTGPMPEGDDVTAARAASILRVLDIVSPGVSAHFVGAERSEAPMSYSGALRPGEDADLEINKGGLRWVTIGEASSGELQGYLEGALRSADEAASLYIRQHRTRARTN